MVNLIMKSNGRKIGIISLLAIVLLTLWLLGMIGLWTSGMAHIANNTKEFTDRKGQVIQREYSMSIDLADLQSNIGKELYIDGTNRIYVSWIHNSGNSRTGGYQIGFRSSGQYSLNHATLISGVHHAAVGEHSFTSNMSAKMTARYNGKVYNSQQAGTSGLNYKDGDDFSFYIFPTDAYQSGEISLDEKGKVYLTVTNLYKNVWTRR